MAARSVQYILPPIQYTGRIFVLQLFNETTFRGKRTDQYIGSYAKYTTPQSNTVQLCLHAAARRHRPAHAGVAARALGRNAPARQHADALGESQPLAHEFRQLQPRRT